MGASRPLHPSRSCGRSPPGEGRSPLRLTSTGVMAPHRSSRHARFHIAPPNPLRLRAVESPQRGPGQKCRGTPRPRRRTSNRTKRTEGCTCTGERRPWASRRACSLLGCLRSTRSGGPSPPVSLERRRRVPFDGAQGGTPYNRVRNRVGTCRLGGSRLAPRVGKWVFHARFVESLQAELARVAHPARLLPAMVARPCELPWDAEHLALPDDVRLRHAD